MKENYLSLILILLISTRLIAQDEINVNNEVTNKIVLIESIINSKKE